MLFKSTQTQHCFVGLLDHHFNFEPENDSGDDELKRFERRLS
jgi:hypothetical protein